MEDLPQEIWDVEILLRHFSRLKSDDDWRDAGRLRQVCKALRDRVPRMIREIRLWPETPAHAMRPYTYATRLCVEHNAHVTDIHLARLTRLTSLGLDHSRIRGYGFLSLTALVTLRLGSHQSSAAVCIALLTGLTSLSLGENNHIRDVHLAPLTRLTELELCGNTRITDTGLLALTALTDLSLGKNRNITDTALGALTGLTSLDLCENTRVTDAGVRGLTALRYLQLLENTRVTDAGLRNLKALTFLCLGMSKKVTDAGVQGLTALDHLDLMFNENITDAAIRRLTALTSLELGHVRNAKITEATLGRLCKVTAAYEEIEAEEDMALLNTLLY